MDLGLEGKVAIITGASKGIGKAVTLELAREGCQVALCARGEEDLQAAATEVGHEIGNDESVFTIPVDASKAEEQEEMVDQVVSRFGTVNILVNNAGGVLHRLPFHELTDEHWLEVLNLNLISAVRLTRAVLPHMRRSGWGRIINIGSESGTQPDALKPHYNASKAALINLTKSLSKAYGEEGIMVNAVSPATTMTPAVEDILSEEMTNNDMSLKEAETAFVEETRPNIVAGRLGRPEEVAAVVAFLASERASFVTGANYRVDSGSVASIS